MKKTWITIAVVAVVVIALFGWVKGVYNGMVEQEESVNPAWSQVENVYQRRADLIPNLVNTVKDYKEIPSCARRIATSLGTIADAYRKLP